VQKNLAYLNNRLVFLFLTLFLLFPAHASDAAKSKNVALKNSNHSSKPSQSKFSQRKRIKKINDLRIIVDISGSMKKTDPNNLRRSAVRLLAGLVPEGSRAGIWNFGKQVNMSVKIGTVNDAWRKLARAESKNISSAGLYTNIESVMRKVSFDWKEPDPRYKRNIIILTDGHVDISKDEKLNKASRRRILKEVLPKFEKAQVRIHTIALSDDVDESLLSTLSAYTDGLYKKVNSADELQKLFLQMLEQSIKLDTLPIKDNKFSVDASINDMTLLVFNKDKSRPTIIISPTNKKWKQSSHPNKVKWFSDEGYDLITIKKPQKGSWKIQAPTDPNNRVVVATNLKLKLNNIPSYLMLGDALNVTAYLEEDEKPLTDKRLLSKFKFVLNRDAERSSERQYPLTKIEGDEFSYNVQFSANFKEGNNELIIRAKSPTAEREIRHQFKVYTTPADIKISESHGQYKVGVTPFMNIMRPNTVKISIELNDKSIHALKQRESSWSIDVDEKYKDSVFKINIEATGADGKPLSLSFDKILSVKGGMQKLDLAAKFKKQEHGSENKPVSEHAKSKVAELKHPEPDKKDNGHATPSEESEHEKKSAEEDEETNWTFIISAIVIGNLLLTALVGGGFVFIKRRKEKIAKNLEGELEEETSKPEASKKKDSEDKKNNE
jgi:uncharacterized protein (TIGR03503 family)